MMIDTNVVIDLTAGEGPHAKSSLECFAIHSAREPIYINHAIYAEVAPRIVVQAEFDDRLAALGIRLMAFDKDDAWRAGKAFQEYRDRGGPRSAILPDFLIGGQAANRGWPIMTRDRRRFETYFPEIDVIDPTKAAE